MLPTAYLRKDGKRLNLPISSDILQVNFDPTLFPLRHYLKSNDPTFVALILGKEISTQFTVA